MTYPRFRRARAHKFIKRATGTAIVLHSTSIAELAAATNGPGTGGFDIALPAQVDDVLEWGFSGVLSATNVQVTFDIYTMVSGSRTNPFGSGLSASIGSTGGVSGWDISAQTTFAAPLVGSALYVVQAGDIVSGLVTMRPYYVEAAATDRTLYSDANTPLMMWAKNLGPQYS